MITTSYRAAVKVPDEVHDFVLTHRLEKDFDAEVMKACEGNDASGGDTYGDNWLWAEFNDRLDALHCEQRLLKVVEKWAQLVPTYEDDEERAAEQGITVEQLRCRHEFNEPEEHERSYCYKCGLDGDM